MLHYIYYKLLFGQAVWKFSNGLTLIWGYIQSAYNFSIVT